jgi:hypothetical protein
MDRVKKFLGVKRELTRYGLQPPKGLPAPNETPKNTGEYKRFEGYIVALSRQTLEKLIIPLIILLSKHDTLDNENYKSMQDRRSKIQNYDPFTYSTENRRIYAPIYQKITPPLLKILAN